MHADKANATKELKTWLEKINIVSTLNTTLYFTSCIVNPKLLPDKVLKKVQNKTKEDDNLKVLKKVKIKLKKMITLFWMVLDVLSIS